MIGPLDPREPFKSFNQPIEDMEREMLKIREFAARVAVPAALTFTVFALGAPVKWSIVAQALAG